VVKHLQFPIIFKNYKDFTLVLNYNTALISWRLNRIKTHEKVNLTLCLLVTTATIAQDRLTGRNFATRSEVIGQHGMVASSQLLATQIDRYS
jgi:hypothetical protein